MFFFKISCDSLNVFIVKSENFHFATQLYILKATGCSVTSFLAFINKYYLVFRNLFLMNALTYNLAIAAMEYQDDFVHTYTII